MKEIFTSSRLPTCISYKGMTGCKWHHCGIVLDDNQVVEASAFHGVRSVSLESFKHRGEYQIIDIPLKDEKLPRNF